MKLVIYGNNLIPTEVVSTFGITQKPQRFSQGPQIRLIVFIPNHHPKYPRQY